MKDRPIFHITKVFEKNWLSTKRIVVNRGGTRSSKTYSASQLIANWLMTGYIREKEHIPKGLCSIVRKYSTTIRSTVQRDFEYVLKSTKFEKTGKTLYEVVNHHKTERTYKYQGRTVEMFGADDQQKIRGYGADILYCNEANELGYNTEFFQLNVRTKRMVLLDFNPSDPYIWINEELEQKRAQSKGDVDVIVSTYKDNQFLTKEQVSEIEYLQTTDSELWEVYGLGNYGKVHGLIFPDITIVDKMPESLKNRANGLDFGYSLDPTAMVHCGVLNKSDLYIDELIYSTGLTNNDIAERMGVLKVPKNEMIYADSAEPKSIEEIRRKGWMIRPTKKGRDSIEYGINLLKQYNLHVTARSQNILKEQKKYKWQQDRDGNFIRKPIDAFNHAIDALRYYAMMELKKGNRKDWFV